MDEYPEIIRAIDEKDYDGLDRLLSASDVNAADKGGYSLLMSAILTFTFDPSVDMVSFLIRKGANVNATSRKGHTALHFASRDQREQIVETLSEAGAAVDATDKSGNTPLALSLTCRSPSLRIVNSLLQAGADPSKKNKYGVSPVDSAKLVANENLLSILTEGRA